MLRPFLSLGFSLLFTLGVCVVLFAMSVSSRAGRGYWSSALSLLHTHRASAWLPLISTSMQLWPGLTFHSLPVCCFCLCVNALGLISLYFVFLVHQTNVGFCFLALPHACLEPSPVCPPPPYLDLDSFTSFACTVTSLYIWAHTFVNQCIHWTALLRPFCLNPDTA